MKKDGAIYHDENAASIELGYIFTFLLGVAFLASFSLWVWDIENATQDRWLNEALRLDVEHISSAIERAEDASLGPNGTTYAEPVNLQVAEVGSLNLRLIISDDEVRLHSLVDSKFDQIRRISGAGKTNHSGEVRLDGVSTVWVILNDGNITINLSQPGF